MADVLTPQRDGTIARQTLPTDDFSQRRRDLVDNPGAHAAGTLLNIVDFYGNLRQWNVETWRVDGHDTEVLITWNDSDGGRRLIIPGKVVAAIFRHRDQLIRKAARRAARQAVATRRARGDVLGNADALKKAREARKTKRTK